MALTEHGLDYPAVGNTYVCRCGERFHARTRTAAFAAFNEHLRAHERPPES